MVLTLVLLAAGTPVRDSAHGFAFTPPPGYVEARDLAPAALHTWARGTVGTESYGVLTLESLGGTLSEGSTLNHAIVEKSAREAAARSGITMKRFDYRTVPWRGIELEVVASWASGNGQELVSLSTQLPLEPEAIQVVMFGPAEQEAQVSRELDAVLTSFEGKVSWGKGGRDRALGRNVGMVAGVGAGIALGLLARRFFRRPAQKGSDNGAPGLKPRRMAQAISGVVRRDVVLQPSPERLDGRRTAVVGGTGGLGQAIARELASRGAQVLVVGQTFRDAGVQNLTFEKADLSSMSEAARIGKSLPADLDVVVLTTGIFAAPKREETAEGLERDMAVSYLSRLAILNELAPRLKPTARVFVMGFPGTGQKGVLGDLNAERSYGSTVVHMNTVAGNEALVLEAARRWPHAAFFGLNPGLIKTNIRANVLGGSTSLRFKLVEGLIGLVMISPEKYAKRIVPVLFASGLEQQAPVMFNQKAKPILATPELDEGRVKQLITESQALVDRALNGGARPMTSAQS